MNSFILFAILSFNLVAAATTPGDLKASDASATREAMSRAGDMTALSQRTVGPDPCQGICTTVPAIQSKQCTAQNSYLEKDTQTLLDSPTFQELKASVPTDLQLRTCIHESQNAHGGPFRTCDAQNQGLSQESMVKPCESDNNLDLISTTFAASVDCLSDFMRDSNTDQAHDQGNLTQEMFSLLSIESGFQVNAVSGTGASGMGQLTRGSVDHMNKLGIDELFKTFSNSEKKSCRAISKLQPTTFKGSYATRCEMISIDKGNPLNNLLYSFYYQKIVRVQIQGAINSLSDSNPGKRALAQASAGFREKLISVAAIWGHNTGPAAIRNPLKNLLSSQAGAALIKAENLDGILKALGPLVASYETNRLHAKPNRVREASRYMHEIQARLAVINKNSGAAAGAPKCGF